MHVEEIVTLLLIIVLFTNKYFLEQSVNYPQYFYFILLWMALPVSQVRATATQL